MGRQFNGTTQAANSTATIDLSSTNKVSLAFWMWWDAFANDFDMAFEFSANYNSVNTGFWVNPNDSGTFFSVAVHGAAGYNVGYYTRPSAAAWHHYVAIFDKSQAVNEIDLYIDGSIATPFSRTTTGNNTENFGNDTLYMMSRASGSLFGAGRLAEIGLWSVVLTGTDASNLNAGALPSSIPTGLVNYWKFCGTTSPEPSSTGGTTITLVATPGQIAHPAAVAGSCLGALIGDRGPMFFATW